MASCITVASRFWPLRSSGLRLMFHQNGAPPCWRAGVQDCNISWERAPCPLRPWTTLMGRRVSSWSLKFVRNMQLRSLDLQSGSTWASPYRPTTRWKLESDCLWSIKALTATLHVLFCISNCNFAAWGWLAYWGWLVASCVLTRFAKAMKWVMLCYRHFIHRWYLLVLRVSSSLLSFHLIRSPHFDCKN